jgi:hypothetical protein
LVAATTANFAAYGVPAEDYSFVAGDMFRVLQDQHFEVDVVLCLGFIYHTLRYGELFSAIAATGAQHCVLDTKVMVSEEPVVRLFSNRTERQANAAEDDLSHDGRTLAGYPSVSALELMLDVYGFDVEEQYDWPALLASQAGKGLSGYSTGERVTLRCRARG